MKRSSFRIGGWPVLALASLAASGAAQNLPEESREAIVTPPGERLTVMPTGIDMRSGQYVYSQTDLSVGEGGETGGIALTRSLIANVPGHTNPFANFSHNWDIMLSMTYVDIDEAEYHLGNGPDYRAFVHFGGRSETFDSRLEYSAFTQASNNFRTTLTYTGSRGAATAVYTYTATDGTVAVFRPLGSINGDCSTLRQCAYVSHVTHPDGTRYDFEYDPGTGPARLRAVSSNRGYALLLQYGGGADANHVVAACVLNLAVQPKPANNACPATPAAAASYGYTTFESRRRLASATDAGGGAWGFAYSRVDGVLKMGFVRPGEGAPWLTNSLSETITPEGVAVEVVDAQAFADGSSTSVFWTWAPEIEGEPPQRLGGYYTHSAIGTTEVEFGTPRMPAQHGPQPIEVGDLIFQITPGPIRVTDPLGRTTTTNYCDREVAEQITEPHDCLVTMAQSFTEPDGRATELTWDGYATRNIVEVRRKAAPGTGLADIVTSATHNCLINLLCNRPTSRTDANDNVTDYVWDPAHGGLISETGPAVNSVRPQTRHAYAQRRAWISNGAGGYAQAATPIWVRTGTSSCRTSAATGNPSSPCAAGALDEVRTVYDYGPDSGPNNLLLRGQAVTAEANGQLETLRTCYGYDSFGRRISETQPEANLGSCP